MSTQNKFSELRKIDVSKHIEKKNNLSYLSWAWAVDQLLQNDPAATWEYREPVRFGDTLMVFCSVMAFDKTMTAQLPVMDHRNRAIVNPDAFQVNVAMQRCLAKAIALHGIGLYIYAGEDLPEGAEDDEGAGEQPAKRNRNAASGNAGKQGDQIDGKTLGINEQMSAAKSISELVTVMNSLPQNQRSQHLDHFNLCRAMLMELA